ncbi:hypothetical protein [Rhodococcus qingshengii]|nr:hypothetical protein [Rhodococcus qingshengii]WCT05970.1 hypothetical protein PI247_29565 [Rhodococcus qingshengii]
MTEYTAMYGSSWQALDGAITFGELEPLFDGVHRTRFGPAASMA